jgi:hypothetical protein
MPGVAMPSKTIVSGPGRFAALVDVQTEVYVTPADEFGNERTAEELTDIVNFGVVAASTGVTKFSVGIREGARMKTGDNKGKYRYTYRYSSAGTYYLHAWVSSQLIGNPQVVMIQPSVGAPEPVNSIVEGAGLRLATAGFPVTFTIRMRDVNQVPLASGGALLVVSLNNLRTGITSVYRSDQIVDQKDGTYLFSHILTVSGDFPVSIQLNRDGQLNTLPPIPRPLRVMPGDPNAENSLITASQEAYPWLASDCLADGTATSVCEFVVRLADRFGNYVSQGMPAERLNVKITGAASPLAAVNSVFCTDSTRALRSTCQEVDSQGRQRVWHENDGMYRVQSSSTASGRYVISVQIDDTHVKGSPTIKSVSSDFADKQRSFVMGSNLARVQAGSQGMFSLYARDMFGNTLDKPFFVDVELLGPQPHRGITNLVNSARMDAFYLVTIAGAYSLNVLLDASPIVGSPFALAVRPAETAPFACIAQGNALTSAVAGTLGTFLIHARDAYGNVRTEGGDDMRVSITGQSIVFGAAQDLRNGSYVGTYDVSIAGVYSLMLFVGSNEFFSSVLHCISGGIDLLETITQTPIPQRLLAGDAVTFAAQARDRFASKITTCTETSKVTVHAVTDDTGQEISYNGTSTLPNGTALCELGLYMGSFRVERTGSYSVSIQISGRHIFRSPYSIQVRAGAASQYKCFARGDDLIIAGTRGPSVARAGVLSTFTIHSRDAFNNRVIYDPFAPIAVFRVVLQLLGTSCRSDGTPVDAKSVCQLATVVNNRDATYSVSYTPTYAGKFEVEATLLDALGNGRLISNSPFMTEVRPNSFEVTRSIAIAPPVNISINSFTTFTVVMRDNFGNNVKQTDVAVDAFLVRRGLSDGDLLPVKKYVTVDDKGDGTYEISFSVTTAARYHMEVMVDGTRILNSPFLLRVEPGLVALQESTADGNGLEGGILGVLATFTIRARDMNGNQLQKGGAVFSVQVYTPKDLARTSGTPTPSVQPVPVDNNDGSYSVAYTSPEAGLHRLRVYAVGKDFSQMLVRGGVSDQVLFMVDDGLSVAGRCIAYGAGLLGGWAGEQSTFKVQMRNKQGLNRPAGGIPLSVTMQSAFEDPPASVNVECTDNNDGIHTCTYRTSIARVYSLVVRLSGENILGSPFTVSVKPAPSSFLWSSTDARDFATMISGETVTFGLQARDEFNNVQVYDSYSGPDAFAAKLEEVSKATSLFVLPKNNEDGTYLFSFSATRSGAYTLAVTLGADEVQTFTNVVVTSSVTMTDRCSVTGLPASGTVQAGELRTLLISARDTYSNLVADGQENFNVTITSSATGTLTTTAYARHCGPPACTLGSSSCPCPDGPAPGVYAFLFVLETVGRYEVSVTRGRFVLPGLPSSFVVVPSFVSTARTTVVGCEGVCTKPTTPCRRLACPRCTCSRLAKMRAGLVESFTIQSRDTYGNAFLEGRKAFRVTARKRIPEGKTACLRSEGCIPSFVEGEVTDNFDGTYSVRWVLSVLGDYDISIMRSGENIEGSPFIMSVLPGLASAGQDGSQHFAISIATAGELQSFRVHTRDVYGNRLTSGGEQFAVRLTGSSDMLKGVVQTGAVEDYEDGTYVCFYRTLFAGTFDLDVKLNGQTIYPGTRSVNVVPGRARARLSTIRGNGLLPQQSAGNVKLDPFYVPPEILVIARDAFRNVYNYDGLLMQVRVSGPQTLVLNSTDKSVARFVQCGPGCGQYVFSNSVQKAGRYTMHIVLLNVDAAGRPTTEDTLTASGGVKFEVTGSQTDASESFFAGPGECS